MAATAVIAAVAVAGTAVSVSESQHSRRLANQKANAARIENEGAMRRQREAQDLEENRAFSKIQRQRQRALAANAAAPVGGGASVGASGSSLLGGGGGAVAGGAAPASTSNKTLLGQ